MQGLIFNNNYQGMEIEVIFPGKSHKEIET